MRLDAKNILRPARFIATATGNVRSALLLGALLVVVVLSLFLFNLRTAAISCTAIPLSLLAAVTVLERLGISLNTMTLGGLAIAIGEVVDDAVIDVENILRRLRENRRREQPLPALRVIYDASIEVRSAVVYATFAVVLVFVPILTMTGVAGRLFAPLGMAYIFAILASLAVALTVTPALCSLLLREDRLPEGEPPVVVWLRARYVPLLVRVERHPRVVIAAVAVLTLGGLAVLPFFGGGFVPELKEGHFVVHMTAVPGTSLAESLRMGGKLSKLLLALPEVRAVGQRVGRADAADDIMGTHSSEIEVDLKPLGGAASRRVEAKIRDVLHGFPGANFAVNTFLSERVEETLSGYGAPVAVNIFGPDLDVLDAKAAAVAAALAKVPGAADVLVQSPPGSPQLVVRLRRRELERWGLDPVTALDAVRTAFQGEVVGQVYDAGRDVRRGRHPRPGAAGRPRRGRRPAAAQRRGDVRAARQGGRRVRDDGAVLGSARGRAPGAGRDLQRGGARRRLVRGGGEAARGRGRAAARPASTWTSPGRRPSRPAPPATCSCTRRSPASASSSCSRWSWGRPATSSSSWPTCRSPWSAGSWWCWRAAATSRSAPWSGS